MYANNNTHELGSVFFGYSLSEIISMFEACHNIDDNGNYNQWSWPNSGSYYDQDKILTELLPMVKIAAQIQIQKKIKLRMQQKSTNGR